MPRLEFHVRADARTAYGLDPGAFSVSGNLVFADFYAARAFAARLNERVNPAAHPERVVKAGSVNAMALIDEFTHAVLDLYRQTVRPDALTVGLAAAQAAIGSEQTDTALLAFLRAFPPAAVQAGSATAESWLDGRSEGVPNRELALEELVLLRLANENPAFKPYGFLFDDADLKAAAPVEPVLDAAEAAFKLLPRFGPDDQDLPTLLRAPMKASPDSLAGQLDFMRRRWGLLLGERMRKLLGGVDMLAEESKPHFPGPGPARVLSYESLEKEYERFSEDRDWMPRVVMIAKSTLVWLDQLSRWYGRDIRTLDAIPDEELDALASRGFNALWLIGLWERSQASRLIKELCGNPEAAPSAYSLYDYEIAGELGGWPALDNLRRRAEWRGIRLAADMVPNHTGMDSAWVRERPDLFIQSDRPPFPGYSFNGRNLSGDPSIGLWLEDHYYDRTDAAVVFKRVDFRTGDTRYIYHGNDGTSMPWNDTAQLDFLKPDAREAVTERILHVARAFPIIRFDAAMIMARKHFRRLWYPEPGHGGDIASRGESSLPPDVFDRHMPGEFWRDVVDRCAAEAPDTLLLAEAFWMMEGYFVRTLGMHRVYNSAFMNMLKNQENKKYRDTIKNTQEFDKDILKRFVNFMNNPDEETAVAQFGRDDRYFGVCTLMATLPGLPMFGHGQVEGFTEKYGMEYRRAYLDERPDQGLIARHEREIFPLLKRRYLFSGVDQFLLYDLYRPDGSVDENVFAYSNGAGGERALVLYNNAYERAAGTLHRSCPFARKEPDGRKTRVVMDLASGLGLSGLPGRFLAMREQRSGLWFLRRSADVAERGMVVMLDGFQSQAFLDIHELADDELGAWAKLCDQLGGSGVPDLSAALQDVVLDRLYASWNAAFGPAYLRTVLDAFAPPDAAPKTSAAGKAGKKAVTPDLDAVSAFARDSGAFMAELAGRSATDAGRAERALELAAGASATLAGLASAGTSKPGSLLAARLRSGAAPAAAALGALSILPGLLSEDADWTDARALADAWGLDRKLREAMQAAGVPGDHAWLCSALATAALGALGSLEGLKATGLAGLAEAVLSQEEASRLLGVNIWDGSRWFNAERFALAAPVALAAAILAGRLSPKQADSALRALERAASESGWNLDSFLSLLKETDAP
ncbi:MAG: alpha-amylase [Spirochaetales bacterium]|nr:alpha-amylase [Spirochaetales bacterium]